MPSSLAGAEPQRPQRPRRRGPMAFPPGGKPRGRRPRRPFPVHDDSHMAGDRRFDPVLQLRGSAAFDIDQSLSLALLGS